jgi:hypothetical protein
MPQTADLAVQAVSQRACFVAEMQLLVATRQLPDHPLHRRRRAVDLANVAYLPIALALGNRHRVLLLGAVKSNKGFAILLHGSPSVHEARLGPPEQPSYLYCTKGRAADLSPRT